MIVYLSLLFKMTRNEKITPILVMVIAILPLV
jgi:hypothetical protein